MRHACRTLTNNLLENVVLGNLEKMWYDNINNYLTKRGCEGGRWMELT